MCRDCDWEDALFLCDEILDEWPANDFAASVSEWVQENEHVTPAQMHQLENLHRRVVDG